MEDGDRIRGLTGSAPVTTSNRTVKNELVLESKEPADWSLRTADGSVSTYFSTDAMLPDRGFYTPLRLTNHVDLPHSSRVIALRKATRGALLYEDNEGLNPCPVTALGFREAAIITSRVALASVILWSSLLTHQTAMTSSWTLPTQKLLQKDVPNCSILRAPIQHRPNRKSILICKE